MFPRKRQCTSRAARPAHVHGARVSGEVSGATFNVSGPESVLVTIGTDSASRRSFRKTVAACGAVAEPVYAPAHRHGTYNRETGAQERETETAYPTMWRVFGAARDVGRVIESRAVLSWERVMSARIPHVAQGASPKLDRRIPPVERAPFYTPPEYHCTASVR